MLVELEPKGWELIGALGRIDLVSGTSYFKLILESSAHWQMEHVSPAGLRLHVPVREDHFKEWLAKLMA